MKKYALTMASSMLVAASVLSHISTSQAYAPAVVAKMLSPSQKQALFDTTGQAQSVGLSRQDLLNLGKEAYWRSCESCHGAEPEVLPHHNRIQFGRVVLNGQGNMPGLGFKLSVMEVEAIRHYLAQVAN